MGTPSDQRTRILLFTAVLCLSLSILAVSLLASDDHQISIVITRDLRGYLEPCDCKAGVLGGFPRRATTVAGSKPDLLLDAGDLVFQASPYDLLKLRLMLELNGKLGYAAVNVGRREAEFSRTEILRLAADSPVPLISANLADREGRRVLPGHIIAERSGIRFGVIGAVTSDANPGDGLQVMDPGVAVRRELDLVRAKVDCVILLAALNADEIGRVLKAAEGIDLVLGGWVPRGSKTLEKVGGVSCFLVQGKGQYYGEVQLGRTPSGAKPLSGRRVVLGPEIPSDRGVESSIHRFKLSLEGLDLLSRDPDRSHYLGSARCAACHGEIHRLWIDSPHAKALGALRPEKGRFDPHCLRCHVTAPGSGGYVSETKTPEFSGVGCESCHGPSRAHAEAPLTAERPRTPGAPRKTCLACHESDHSRPFHAKERFEAINHWVKAKEKER